MRLVHRLFFNDKYRSLFYLLPLLIMGFVTYYFYSLNGIGESKSIEKPKRIKKEKSLKLFDFMFNLEEEIKNKNLNLKNIKITPKKVILQIEDDFLKSLKIIDFIEKFSSKVVVKKLSFKVLNDNKIDLYIEIELNKKDIFYKKLRPKEVKNKVLYQKKVENNLKIPLLKDEKEAIKIEAIIDNSVLVNNKWYKIGEKINGKKVISINRDFIELENNNHKTNIWIYQNEYTR